MVRRRGDVRGLVTLLFTDIVGSSDVASELGDERWHRLQARHHAAVRRQLKRYSGHEIDTAGDGFFITFSSPTQGVRCAFAIVQEVRELGLDVRAGLHIGDAQLTGEKVGGIAVTTAARVSVAAGPGQVLATDTIVHMVAGSGFEFTDLGSHELKGVPGRWELFSLDAVDGESIGPPLDPQQASEYRIDAANPPERVPHRGRVVVVAVTVAAVLAIASVALLARPTSTPTAGESFDIAGHVLDQSVGVFNSSTGQLVRYVNIPGGGGPVVLPPLSGNSGQSFAWLMSGHLLKIDRSSGNIVDTIDPHRTRIARYLAYDHGRVWFAFSNSTTTPDKDKGVWVRGIDVNTDRGRTRLVSRTLPWITVSALAAGGGALWLGTSDGTVYRVDGRRDAERMKVSSSVDGLAFGEGSLWTIDAPGYSLWRVDPESGNKTRIPLPGQPSSIAVGGGFVWVTDQVDGTLLRISIDDLAEGQLPVGNDPAAVVFADGFVWVASPVDYTVVKITPSPMSAIHTFTTLIASTSLGVNGNEIWVVTG